MYNAVMTDMDVTDAARALGVSERTIRRWLRAGRLSGYRVGRRIRIPENAVREAVAPYGTDGPPDARADAETDPILRFLRDPARRRARREAAARVMDRIAEMAGQPKSFEDTAVGLMRAVRKEEERKWERILGLDRS